MARPVAVRPALNPAPHRRLWLPMWGWAIPGLVYVYLPLLLTSLIAERLLGYCVLTKWEFAIRKRLYPASHYEHSFLIHYGRRLFHIERSDKLSKKSTKMDEN